MCLSLDVLSPEQKGDDSTDSRLVVVDEDGGDEVLRGRVEGEREHSSRRGRETAHRPRSDENDGTHCREDTQGDLR